MAAIMLIIIGVLTRLIPHSANFSPLVGIALFSGVYLNKKHAYLIPLAIYVLSDIIIGLHSTILFTWGSILLIYYLGSKLRNHKTVGNIGLYTIVSSILFFVVTNFGVWLLGWYGYSLEGFIRCFMLAIPFFRTSLLANFIYVGLLFGTYEYFLRKFKLAKESIAF